jgi:hypothetical protein
MVFLEHRPLDLLTSVEEHAVLMPLHGLLTDVFQPGVLHRLLSMR